MSEVDESYRSLRNHLRKLGLQESLGVIRAYSQNMLFDAPIPGDIQVAEDYYSPNWANRPFHPWDLEALAKELILHAPDLPGHKTLRDWGYLARAYNKLRDLEGSIWTHHRSELKANAMLELFRIAHRQFPWQRNLGSALITRYFKIFSDPELDSILEKTVGVNARVLYTLGLAMLGSYTQNIAINQPTNIEIDGIDVAALDLFRRRFSCPLEDLRERIRHSQHLDEKYLYAYNPLRAYPLIQMDFGGRPSSVCPLPALLMFRFTDGVYYEICGDPHFGDRFGRSFQQYVGEVLRSATDGTDIEVVPEQEYRVGRQRKDTVDWRAADQEATLFIECKTKRLRVEAQAEIISSSTLENELEFLADAVTQVYRNISDYRDRLFPQDSDDSRAVYPMVVTLKDWYLFGGKPNELLDIKIRDRIKEMGINESELETMPYTVCSVEDLEQAMQVMARRGIHAVMSKKLFCEDYRWWSFRPFLSQHFPEELKLADTNLFPDDAGKIHPIIRRGRDEQGC